MFKIYLSRKLHQAESSPDSKSDRNRRLFERFDVSGQHILALNDQDILRIKDISAKGFSCQVSERAYDKFVLQDVYEARLKYLGETFEVELKVAWKGTDLVGFELINPSEETLTFFKRLLLPMEVARTIQKTEAVTLKNLNENKTWYHDDNGTDFILWRDEESELDAWQLVASEQYIEWNRSGGLRTGVTQAASPDNSQDPTEELMIPDESPNPERIRLATDVMMALLSNDSKEVLPTLTEKSWDYESESTNTDDV